MQGIQEEVEGDEWVVRNLVYSYPLLFLLVYRKASLVMPLQWESRGKRKESFLVLFLFQLAK